VPLQHYAVTAGTSFSPNPALEGGDLYYWYVIANNGPAAGPASPIWSFWVTGAASNASVSPQSGQGITQAFTFTFASPNGAQDIAWTEMEFNYYNVGSGACFIGFWPGNGQVALMSDNASNGWLWVGNLGQAQATAANSQCSVNLAASSMAAVSAGQVQVQVTLAITFLAGLPGPQQIWMQAGNNAGTTAPWQQMGTWTTSAVACPGCAPVPVSEAPPNGSWSGAGGTFAYRFSSPNGRSYLTELTAVFNQPGQPLYMAPGACRVEYNLLTNDLVIENDAGGYDATVETKLGAGQVIQNSQCAVNAAQSSIAAVDANTNAAIAEAARLVGRAAVARMSVP